MRYILIMFMLIAVAPITASGVFDVIESLAARAEEASVSSEVEVVELFQAQTPEELEAALTDGYPMPWLEEILNDESIPEEDRYWLDCRVRAHVAKYLHRFYDRNCNPVEVEAEWISPGEHYWQEHLMVNPVGEDYGFGETPDYLPDFTGEPGTIVNLYGEQTGEMALTQRGIIMSRDGTIGVLKTGPGDAMHSLAPNYACFIYADGSFKEIEVDLVRAWEHINVSWDGELIVVCCKNTNQDQPNGYLQAFDHDGNTLYTTEIAGTAAARPAISPDNRYIAVALHSPIPRSIVILDAQTGELLRRFPVVLANQVAFSTDGTEFGYAGAAAGVGVLELSRAVDNWSFEVIREVDEIRFNQGITLCAERDLLSLSVKDRNDRMSPPYFNDYSQLLCHGKGQYRVECSNLDISPNGQFAFGFNSRMAQTGGSYSGSFITVISISIRERG